MPTVRDKGDGSIYLRADSLRWTAAVTMHGKRATKSCPHRHKPAERRPCDEARANLAELLRLRDVRAPSGGHRLSLGQYLAGWLDDVRPNLAPATYRKHESICRVHLSPALGTTLLSELSVGAVRAYLVRGGNGQSLRHHRATLRRALADALRDGLVTRNVAALAEPPRLIVRERTFLDAAQCRALIEGTRDDRLHALWVLAVTTGMREAEMLGLEWSAVDLDAATATVSQTLHRCDGRCDLHVCFKRRETDPRGWELRETKTAKSRRTVSLPPVTVDALRAHKVKQLAERAAAGRLGRAGLVFTSATGWPIHGENLSKLLYTPPRRDRPASGHLVRLGLPRVTVHMLRHSAATVLISLGVPLIAVSRILGHSTIRITADIYSHALPELERDAADRMQGAVG